MWDFLDHMPRDDHDDIFAGSPLRSNQMKVKPSASVTALLTYCKRLDQRIPNVSVKLPTYSWVGAHIKSAVNPVVLVLD